MTKVILIGIGVLFAAAVPVGLYRHKQDVATSARPDVETQYSAANDMTIVSTRAVAIPHAKYEVSFHAWHSYNGSESSKPQDKVCLSWEQKPTGAALESTVATDLVVDGKKIVTADANTYVSDGTRSVSFWVTVPQLTAFRTAKTVDLKYGQATLSLTPEAIALCKALSESIKP
jgi:hypothetical protein